MVSIFLLLLILLRCLSSHFLLASSFLFHMLLPPLVRMSRVFFFIPLAICLAVPFYVHPFKVFHLLCLDFVVSSIFIGGLLNAFAICLPSPVVPSSSFILLFKVRFSLLLSKHTWEFRWVIYPELTKIDRKAILLTCWTG